VRFQVSGFRFQVSVRFDLLLTPHTSHLTPHT
jgi:hypothetical protein